MGKYLGNFNFIKLVQEEIENLNSLLAIKNIESVIKNGPTRTILGTYGFKGEFY